MADSFTNVGEYFTVITPLSIQEGVYTPFVETRPIIGGFREVVIAFID